MKKLTLNYVFLFLLAFASCKKDNPARPQPKPVVIAALNDSVSYTLDGKTYSSGAGLNSRLAAGWAAADRTLVVNPDGSYALTGSGRGDTLSFYQQNIISSNTGGIVLYFVKKITKTKTGLPFPTIDNLLPSFAIGKHLYAEDFEWQNAQNGIALSLMAGNRWYTTYNGYNHEHPIVIKPGFQENSSFEITSFNTATSGGYNLQAKFSAVLIDNATGELKKLDNGYLQINFSPMVAAGDN